MSRATQALAVAALSLLVSLVGTGLLWKQGNARVTDNSRNIRQLCNISDAFLGADLALQNAQGKQTIQTLGLRQEVVAGDVRMLAVLTKAGIAKNAPPSTVAFIGAWITQLQAERTLNLSIVSSTQDVQAAREKASDRVRELRTELKCVS